MLLQGLNCTPWKTLSKKADPMTDTIAPVSNSNLSALSFTVKSMTIDFMACNLQQFTWHNWRTISSISLWFMLESSTTITFFDIQAWSKCPTCLQLFHIYHRNLQSLSKCFFFPLQQCHLWVSSCLFGSPKFLLSAVFLPSISILQSLSSLNLISIFYLGCCLIPQLLWSSCSHLKWQNSFNSTCKHQLIFL